MPRCAIRAQLPPVCRSATARLALARRAVSSTMRTLRAQLADRACYSSPAAPRCPVTRRRPASFSPVARGVAGRFPFSTLHLCTIVAFLPRAMPRRPVSARLAPDSRFAMMRPALLRCAAVSTDVHAARQRCCKPMFVILRQQCLATRPAAVPERLARPSPSSLRGVAVSSVALCVPLVIWPRAIGHRAFRASRFGHAGCNYAARSVEPRRVAQGSACRAPTLQKRVALLSAGNDCLAVRRRPALLSPVARGDAGRCRATLRLARRS